VVAVVSEIRIWWCFFARAWFPLEGSDLGARSDPQALARASYLTPLEFPLRYRPLPNQNLAAKAAGQS